MCLTIGNTVKDYFYFRRSVDSFRQNLIVGIAMDKLFEY